MKIRLANGKENSNHLVKERRLSGRPESSMNVIP